MPKSRQTPFWSAHLGSQSLPENISFCAGRDIVARPMADAELLPFDLWTNRVSAIALAAAGIITETERRKLLRALTTIEKDFQAGKRQLDPGYEDVHMNVEIILGELVGKELAGKIHTGRSRNDQSATDLRLLLRAAALRFAEELLELAAVLLELAEHHKQTICPGFSHGQPAMVTTFGHTILGYLQAIGRDLERFDFFQQQINRSPLGAAAGWGTSWPLDRHLMAGLLGFEEIEENSLDTVTSRGELESLLAFNMASAMNHLAQIANDLYFLSHPYLGLVSLDESLVTGSSIMPQKKNPDPLEVLRAKATLAQGYLHTLIGLGGKNLSGYNRDSQWSKYPVLDLIFECASAPNLIKQVVMTLKVNAAKMHALATQDFLNAIELADLLSRERGLNFRDAYRIAGQAAKVCCQKGLNRLELKIVNKVLQAEKLESLSGAEEKRLCDPLTILNGRRTIGAASVPLISQHMKSLRSQLSKTKKAQRQHQARLDAARQKIASYL